MLDALAVHQQSARTFVERKLGIYEIPMLLQQPVDAVVGTAAFLVGGKCQDQIAVSPVTFALESQQGGDPDGGLRFVVRGAAAIEVAVLFKKYEGVDTPILAPGL